MIQSGSRKRKHRSHHTSHRTSPPVNFLSHHEGHHTPHGEIDEWAKDTGTKPQGHQDPLHALYIQAYEADLVRGGSHAKSAAQSLEVVEYNGYLGEVTPKIGSALIRLGWGGGDTTAGSSFTGKRYRDGDEDDLLPPVPGMQDTEIPIWVDRYDARLLLDTLPYQPKVVVPSPQPDSPSGWSDLPSDTEDTFFFTPDETEDFRREKRRRLIEQTREERLKARMEEDDVDDDEENEDVWGGSDEEPDDPQQELMRRTANHLLSSPNPAQLEMRILANYGSDKRFAFLRGRWSRRWKLVKVKARLDKEKEQEQIGKEKKDQVGLGMITGYGSDDDDDDISDGGGDVDSEGKMPSKVVGAAVQGPLAKPSDSTTAVEEAAKEARRKRAKEWAEKRREMKFKDDTIS